MNTKIFATDSISLFKAAEIIKSGGLVAFPTETVYGLGADGLNEGAVAKIYEAKGRPSDNPLILHVSSIADMKPLVDEVPDRLEALSQFMPGPLTVVMKRSDIVPDIITAGRDTVAIRIPAQPTAQRFIRLCGCPVAAPSANISGRPSPTTAAHVIEDFDGKIEGVINGEDCQVGLESTVLDMSVDTPTILRPGGVTKEQLEEVLEAVLEGGLDKSAPKAPGMKYRHYSPKMPLIIKRGDILEEIKKHPGKVGVLVNNSDLAGEYVLSLGNSPKEYAANLFKCLREFDRLNVDIIIAQDIQGGGICEAVRNRLYKAALKIID